MIKNFFCNRSNYILNSIVLDKYQTKAIIDSSSCYLVIAGAGSGKSLTIVAKVNYLIEKMNISPKKILCISFTNETVDSLKSSLEKNNILVDVKTFHRLSLDIISNRYKIASQSLLEYVISEYFFSYIYFDDTYKLLDFYIENNNVDKEGFIKYFSKIILSFIHSFKSYNYDINYFLNIIFSSSRDDKILLIIIFKVYVLYEEELASQSLIDFDDMINLAIERVDCLKYFRYEYVIIDEFQDTSNSKYELIKKLYDKYNLKLMAVGDDFQSIYSFTGCNLDIFLNFKKNFSNSKIIKLKNNYRNPKDIVDISRRFILKNRRQMKKVLKSNRYINNSLYIVYYHNIVSTLASIVDNIDNVLILGRNNFDINLLLDDKVFIRDDDNNIIYLKNKNKHIRYLTVHSSKGLESDNVIVLNLVDSYFGFPNQIKECELFKYIDSSNKKDKFLYAEERRLFYVALTRSKNKTYLFTNKNNPSVFIKELLHDYKLKIKILDFE